MDFLTCSVCKKNKVVGDFSASKRSKTGYKSCCRICKSKHRKLVREKIKHSRMSKRTEQCHKFAEQHNGKFLSLTYIRSHTRYRWCCSEGHNFEMAYYVVRRGSWCQVCGINSMTNKMKVYSVEDYIHIAGLHNGEFVRELDGTRNKRCVWRCSCGYEWDSRFSVVRKGSWCPQCAVSYRVTRHENYVRRIFEYAFGKKFPTLRPDWLINDKTGYKMELDGYCTELKLAFEYDGELHSRRVGFFKNNVSDQQYRDQLKDKLCVDNGITLFRISYKDKNNILKVVGDFIHDKFGIIINDFKDIDINVCENVELVKTRTCTKCGKEKDLGLFYKSKSGMYGRHSTCKVCYNKAYVNKEKNKEYYENNRDKISETNHQYYLKNREKIIKQSSEYNRKKV